MTSTRLILIFLGFIFLIIVILSSNRISDALRSRFGGAIPSLRPVTEEITPTPTIEAISQTPTPTIIYGRTNGNSTGKTATGTVKSIPASGPSDLFWLISGGSFVAGILIKKMSARG